MIEVKCSVCGRVFDSSVVKQSYRRNQKVDEGCPYCGVSVPLLATKAKRKKKDE